MNPIQNNQPKTPTKTKLLCAPSDEMCFIISAEKQKGIDFMQEMLLDPSQPDILFFSSCKESYSNQQSISKSYESINEIDSQSREHSSSQEKYQTVKKSSYENLILNQGKNLTATQSNKKGCNCDKSRCLKNYCVCYKVGNTCSSDCQCIDCANVQITSSHLKNQKMALDLLSNNKQKGCNCKNSNCLKNYCLCHQYGRKCSQMCKCENCHNSENKFMKDDDDKQQKMKLKFQSGKKKIKISQFQFDGNQNQNKENISYYNNFNY